MWKQAGQLFLLVGTLILIGIFVYRPKATAEQIAANREQRALAAVLVKPIKSRETSQWMLKLLRAVGFITRVVTYAVGFALLYAFSPDDISRKPIGSLTLGEIAGSIGAAVMALVLIKALFSPSQDKDIREAWSSLGWLMVGGAEHCWTR
jgi:hypothetical protein